MNGRFIHILFLTAFAAIICFSEAAYSNERKFTYVYQSSVLSKDSKEVEIWTTPRLGKQNSYFARIDNRIEFELGLSKKLQTAFYINFSNTTSDNGSGVNSTLFDFKGISTEFKYQVTNPYLDALGFALYGELGLNTNEIELETKLIFDKRVKKTTLALNLTAEPEWKLTPKRAEYKLKFESSFGLSYDLTSSFSAGFEVRNANTYTKDDGWNNSVLFAGPVFSYSQSGWWAAFTVMPQIVGFKGKSSGSNLNLSEFEKFESRLLISLEL